VEFSRAMIDQGADLVLGHGPHVPRALELYKSRIIAYSLGNFMGYRTLSTDGVLGNSLILETQLAADGRFISGNIIPVQLDNRGVPSVDDSFRSVSLIRNLIESDFPVTPLLIGNNGEIIINEAE
ncbi:poly-gamma-glutamate biosynthesis protein, partial [filamentous cyanobacterium CCP1]